MTSTLRQTVTCLGWCGLIPFLLAPLSLYLYAEYTPFLVLAITAYALTIVSFLAGAWWGIALLRNAPTMLIASIVLAVLAWVGFIIAAPRPLLFLLASLLVVLFAAEREHAMFKPQPDYYAVLRMRLTAVASLSLYLCALLL